MSGRKIVEGLMDALRTSYCAHPSLAPFGDRGGHYCPDCGARIYPPRSTAEQHKAISEQYANIIAKLGDE